MRLQPHQLKSLREHPEAPLPPPLPRKKRSREESIMQCQLIEWWKHQCKNFGVAEQLLFKIKNEGRAGSIGGAINKAEGLRKGAPDLMLAVARDVVESGGRGPDSTCWMEHYHALFLELKRRDGVLSPEQKIFHQLLRDQGYKCVVCWSLTECINEITAYLK